MTADDANRLAAALSRTLTVDSDALAAELADLSAADYQLVVAFVARFVDALRAVTATTIEAAIGPER